jgi:hypothetical protein
LPQIATFRLSFQQFACTCDIRIRHIFDAMLPLIFLNFRSSPLVGGRFMKFSPNTVNDAALLLEMQWTICVKFEANETRPLGSSEHLRPIATTPEAVRKWLYKLRPTHARHGNETLLDIDVPLQE